MTLRRLGGFRAPLSTASRPLSSSAFRTDVRADVEEHRAESVKVIDNASGRHDAPGG
jgi:hypothetical protein